MSNKLLGVLLLNLGTPDSPTIPAIRKYLLEFLSDPRVIELPWVLRQLLLRGFIIPARIKKVAHAYKSIWQETGSPLFLNSQALQQSLQRELGNNYCVALGMRYGNPSIASALQSLTDANVAELIIVPLFPQYASAVTGSALELTMQTLTKNKVIKPVRMLSNFYDNQHYIQALAASLQPYLQQKHDFLLMSYHGLPQRQLINPGIDCYKTQCLQTSSLVANVLGLAPQQWSVSFQSRLGKLPWIRPYTDEVLVELRSRNVQRLLICCPSFIADCLETLEEIGIRAKQHWLHLGGEDLQLIPCLNAQQQWVSALSSIIK